MKRLGGDVTVAAAEQYRRKRHALTRRAQAGGTQFGNQPIVKAGASGGNGGASKLQRFRHDGVSISSL